MFTGIVADRGEVVEAEAGAVDGRLWIRSSLLADCSVGASVSVDGVCLTVVDVDADVCRFDVSAETVSRSTLGTKEPGDHVNLERPVRAGDELGGHIVQGHVDAVGTVLAVVPDGEGSRLVVAAPADLLRYVVQKGSVTVDGVSLTASDVREDAFEIALEPHTVAVTTLGDIQPGRKVNIEVDVLAKYVEKLRSSN